jgi:transcriptional regulator with XRE-family HTH domain
MRAARVAAGLSQADVEKASGVPKTMLSRYENNHVSPSLDSLSRIALAIGVSQGSLLGEPDIAVMVLVRELEARGIAIESLAQATEIADMIGRIVGANATVAT